MKPAGKRRATYQDILEAPEHKVAEIIDGDLRLFNRPGGPATATASLLGYELGPPFMHGRGGPGGWLIFVEPELHLGEDIVVPDLAGWRRERMPLAPAGAFFTVAPDWVCEVLSKSTEGIDRTQKMPLYASWNVQYAWLVDPRQRTLEGFRLHDGRWVPIATHSDGDLVRIEPFQAIDIDLSLLWSYTALPRGLAEDRAHDVIGGY
jgi:Uma2 family endonuclease